MFPARSGINTVADDAAVIFFDHVAKRFPEVKSGDFDPLTLMAFTDACRVAVTQWLGANWPEDQDREDDLGEAADLLGSMANHEACQYTIKATSEEIIVHIALVMQNGGPLESCGVDQD